MIVSSLKTRACFSVNLHSKIDLSVASLHKVNLTYLCIANSTMTSKQADDGTSDHITLWSEDDQVDVRVTHHASRHLTFLIVGINIQFPPPIFFYFVIYICYMHYFFFFFIRCL